MCSCISCCSAAAHDLQTLLLYAAAVQPTPMVVMAAEGMLCTLVSLTCHATFLTQSLLAAALAAAAAAPTVVASSHSNLCGHGTQPSCNARWPSIMMQLLLCPDGTPHVP